LSESGATAASRTTSRVFWIVIGLIVLYVLLDAVAQVLPPHYSPISQAESDLAVGPYGYLMALNFLNRGLLSILFVVAFLRYVDAAGGERGAYRVGVSLLGVWAVGAVVLAAFPADVPPASPTLHGAIHLVVAIIAFLGGAFGALLISVRLGKSQGLKAARGIAVPVAVLAVLACLVVLLLPGAAPHLSNHIGGLTERVFLGLVLGWMLLVSAFALRSSGH